MINEKQVNEYKYEINFIIENKIVGYIFYEKIYEVLNITDVFVEEKYRNNKIASKLFEYLISKYKNEYLRFMLEVNEHNEIAINLYTKFGFKKISERKKYYKDGNAVIMEMINE